MGINIEKAFCLCIDKRQKHWQELEDQCVSKDIPFEKFIAGKGDILDGMDYDYIDEPDPEVDSWVYGHPDNGTWVNHYNAFVCHQRIIQKAKDQKLENFLLLEDDAYFTDRYDDVWGSFAHLFEDPEPIEWDMIYFGWWIEQEEDEWNKEVERVYKEETFTAMSGIFTNTGGMHGVLINNSMYDSLLRLNPVAPIDMQLNLMYHQGPRSIKSFIVIPKIIHDTGIFSEADQNPNPRKKL